MSTHTFKKCPHCGKTYETYSIYTKNYHKHSGSPFVKCRFCGNTFVDKDIKEPALKPYSSRGFSWFNCIFAFFIPFGALGILLTCAAFGVEDTSIVLFIVAFAVDLLYLSLTIYSFVNRKKLIEEDKKEYEESERRLSDPIYAHALKEAGFKVPEKYLK